MPGRAEALIVYRLRTSLKLWHSKRTVAEQKPFMARGISDYLKINANCIARYYSLNENSLFNIRLCFFDVKIYSLQLILA